MSKFRILAVVVLAGAFVACCPCRKAVNRRKATFMGVEWKLVQWGARTLPSDAVNYTVKFTEDGKITGMGDCNRFTGSYNLEAMHNDNKVAINQIASTRMACPDMAKENEFFDMLKKTTRVDLDGDILILNSTDRLVFEKK